MLPFRVVTALDAAICRAQACLLALQAPDGHWVGEVEAPRRSPPSTCCSATCSIASTATRERKAVRYLRRRQRADGGFNLFEDGPTNLSATIKAYFAMKMAGVADGRSRDGARARRGSARWAGRSRPTSSRRSCSRCSASTTGTACRRCRPRSCCSRAPFFFNIYEVSYWSRTVIVPLLDPHGPQAGQVRCRRGPVARRAVAGAARAREPALPARAAAVRLARRSSGRTSSSPSTTA